MKIYLVGGAVRDALLGLSGSDRDWLVVGSTPEEMASLGYQPVGKDFPVFLHPETREEYALARTERKTARGYKGFAVHASPDVTLEEDLARRDLTVNAIAQDPKNGEIFDPYRGRKDLEHKVLRHVTDAFREDPVRILRIARFASRFPDFEVASETLKLMKAMVDEGEVDALVSERVWQEIARGLMGKQPSRMLQVLRACGALQRLLPEVDRLYGVPQRAEYHPEIDTGIHLEMVQEQRQKTSCLAILVMSNAASNYCNPSAIAGVFLLNAKSWQRLWHVNTAIFTKVWNLVLMLFCVCLYVVMLCVVQSAL